MNIIVSTNAMIKSGLEPLKELLQLDKDFGIELFPNEKNKEYQEELFKIAKQENRYLTYHGPYFDIEHSAPKGTKEYEYSMSVIKEVLPKLKELNIKSLVFHHSNKVIENKEQMINTSTENLKDIQKMANEYSVEILVENAGVDAKRNSLFNEEEFINICKSYSGNVLIDVGHVNANQWNINNIIESLSDKIVAYHLHNNDGYHDGHDRVQDGTFDLDNFFDLYHKHTPDADLILEYNYDLGYEPQKIIEDLNIIREKSKKDASE